MKLLKILILFFILLIALFSNVYATETESSNSLDTLNSLFATTSTDEASEETAPVTTSNPIQINDTSSDGSLSISDVINIILIAVGLVLIFLGVAILLRSK